MIGFFSLHNFTAVKWFVGFAALQFFTYPCVRIFLSEFHVGISSWGEKLMDILAKIIWFIIKPRCPNRKFLKHCCFTQYFLANLQYLYGNVLGES